MRVRRVVVAVAVHAGRPVVKLGLLIGGTIVTGLALAGLYDTAGSGAWGLGLLACVGTLALLLGAGEP